jgi:hypothetical protein
VTVIAPEGCGLGRKKRPDFGHIHPMHENEYQELGKNFPAETVIV